jgi:hypothetical protein
MNKTVDNSCNNINTNNKKTNINDYYNVRSVGFASIIGKYTTEEINKSIYLAKKQCNLITYYIDHIRNYNILTEEMLTNIDEFDNYSKMIIIRELNKVVTVIHFLVDQEL